MGGAERLPGSFKAGLKTAEVSANLRVRPVGVAHNFAANHAFAVDDVGLGPAVGAIQFGYLLVGIANRVQINVEPREKAPVGARVLVDADRENGDVGAVMMELNQRRCLLDAGRALA